MMHIPSLKSITKTADIKYLPDAPCLYMPLGSYQQEMKPLVQQGDYVKKYQLIAQSEDNWKIQLHSPVSGYVAEITTIKEQSFLKINNDFEDNEEERNITDVKALSKPEILELIKNAGIVGSGGAGFPTHLKYNTEGFPISHFIVNGAECEPFLSADYAIMKHEIRKVLLALVELQKLTASQQIVLAIEKQHRELKIPIKQISKEVNLSLHVHLLDNTYPQGGELQLIKSVTGKELPKGSIPAKYGVVVSNIGTVYAIANTFFNGHPYVERVITVSGEAVQNPGNFKVMIGTPVSHILKQFDVKWQKETHHVILGGPMMGAEVSHLEQPITKGSGGLLVLDKKQSNNYNCIHCGYCSDVCPQNLMPMEFARYAVQEDKAALMKYQVNSCIECAACAYACPSDVKLMESIKFGKQLLRRDK